MNIKKPVIAQIASHTWCINEYGMDTMFLLEGDEKALLIDTGTGTFDIRQLTSLLTNKPMMVVLTHGHVDHAGGMDQFDEVYLHPDDMEMARDISLQDKKDYTRIIREVTQGLYEVDESHVREESHLTNMRPLYGGTVIQLGNRPVEVYETPGHTPGGLSFLDIKERIFFTGDACNSNTLMSYSSFCGTDDRPKSGISDLQKTAELIQSLHDQYDRNYNGHIGYGSTPDMLPLPEGLVENCIDLCKDILSGKVVGEPVKNWCGENLLARTEMMQIQYIAEQVR